MDEYDVAIIGCGPAGLTAAIFCGRANLKTILIGKQEKSQAYIANNVQNYLGFPDGIDGSLLLHKGSVQAQKFGVQFIRQEAVSATPVESGDRKSFIVKTSQGQELGSRALIIATGIPIRLSGIANEESLTGKGVHYCVSCDGPFYKNKSIAIVGNSNHAAEDAIEALNYTKDVTIISNSTSFDFSEIYHDSITKYQIRTVLAKVREFKGEKWLESLVLEDGNELKFSGVFMACGTAGALDFAANLGLEIRENMLVVDENSMTSMEGVFAAGNCAGKCRQIAKNVGDGCNAAVSAIKYLRSRELYLDYVHSPTQPQKEGEQAKIVVPAHSAVMQSLIPQHHIKKKKLRIGWFSFSCCEDSTILFTELLNDHWDEWKNLVEVVHARVLKKNNVLRDIDVSFVEGAISNDKAAAELQEIRKNSKKLVAIGACACTGLPSAQRNNFDDSRKMEIEPIIRAFDYNKQVLPLDKVIQVDDRVPGCPMTESGFLAVLEKYLKEFDIHAQF